MAITPLKEKDLNIVPVNWRKLIQEKINLLIGANTGVSKKTYKALITQVGTSAPTVIVLENTIGDIVWTYSGVGAYRGTLVGAFPLAKTFYNILALQDAPAGLTAGLLIVVPDYIILSTSDNLFNAANDVLVSTPIEIEVYL